MRTWITILLALLTLGISRGDDQLAWQDVATATEVWKELAGFRQWPLVPGTSALMPGQAPHGRYISVHLNPIAVRAIEENRLQMLEGAIIAKENFGSTRVLHRITAMKKLEGAWFWAEYDPDGTVQVAGRLKGCEACHAGARRDMVFTWR